MTDDAKQRSSGTSGSMMAHSLRMQPCASVGAGNEAVLLPDISELIYVARPQTS
jgi:hypothetical protein